MIDLTNMSIASLVGYISVAVAFIKGLEFLIDKLNQYIRKQSKKDNEPLESNQKELNNAFSNITQEILTLKERVTRVEEDIKLHNDLITNHKNLLGNDNEHLKRHDIAIADIQHKTDEDRYMNTKCFQVLIRNAIGLASEEDLKKVDNELNKYILTKSKN